MSHNIEYFDYDISKNPKDIEANLANYVQHETWQEGGSMSPIRWLKQSPLPDRNAAEQFIKRHDKRWYDCLAVRYKEPVMTQAIRDAQKAEAAAWKKYNDLGNEIYVTTLTSEFISCKVCKSKLNRKMLAIPQSGIPKNVCPVCHAELRPKSTLERIDRAKKAAEKASEHTNEVARKSKKQNVRWLVKIEYHT